jgi:putative inorganic carbon (HCO3(-)) transporter
MRITAVSVLLRTVYFFEVLGQHGYIGLAIFLAIGFTTWHSASRIRKAAANEPRAQWCVTLASMCQVSLLGYAVGGAFLTLAFYDLPYYLMAVVVMTRAWVEQRAWEREELPASSARALAVAQRKALPVGPRGA